MSQCYRYTITHLHEDLDRFKPRRIFVVGHLGSVEIQRDQVMDILRDGLTATAEPGRTSPYLLTIPRTGWGIMRSNPGGKRSRNGLRGTVRIRTALHRSWASRGTSRTRSMYRDREPAPETPLIERIQTKQALPTTKRSMKNGI
jgi:hypothetical protein